MENPKSRHGCLTAWLVLMLITNSAVALGYLVGMSALKQTYPNAPGWAFPTLILAGTLNVICAIALLRWKKWGFWGFCATALITLAANMSMGLGIASALGGVLGVLILYGVLHIGKENKGWPQLE